MSSIPHQPRRVNAAKIVALNWRVRKRCPRITALAMRLGYIQPPR